MTSQTRSRTTSRDRSSGISSGISNPKLPDDILRHIPQYLPVKSRLKAASANTLMNSANRKIRKITAKKFGNKWKDLAKFPRLINLNQKIKEIVPKRWSKKPDEIFNIYMNKYKKHWDEDMYSLKDTHEPLAHKDLACIVLVVHLKFYTGHRIG